MKFSRQEYWSGLPFPTPKDLPGPGVEPKSVLTGGFFTTGPPGKLSLLNNELPHQSSWLYLFIFFTKPCLSSRPQHWAFRNVASAVFSSSPSWLGLARTLKTLQLELSWKPCLQSMQILVFWGKSGGEACSLVPALNQVTLPFPSLSALPRSPCLSFIQ